MSSTPMITGNYQYSTTSPLANLTFATAAAADTHKKEFPFIVSVGSTTMQIEKNMGFEGAGAAPIKLEGHAPQERAITESYVDTATQKTYGLEWPLTLEQQMFSMNNAQFVKQVSYNRSRSISLAYENNAVVPYTSGFATTQTSDAVYVFSASHTWKSDSSTFSNLLTTSVLDKTAVQDALIQTEEQELESNVKAQVMPKELRYGTTHIMAVKEVLKTMKDPDTANNTFNPVTDWNLKPVLNHYFAANDWFMSCAESKDEELVHLAQSKAPTYGEDRQESGAMNIKMTSIAMFSVGTRHRNAIRLYGNAGA